MVDVVDRQTRARMMAGIKGTNTKPELLLRRALHARGFRFRIHEKRLPGKPDIVLPKWRVAIQVHGCFWHRHEGCTKASNPGTNVAFWQEKFAANVARDQEKVEALLAMGWRVLIVWECSIGSAMPEHVVDKVTAFVTAGMQSGARRQEIGAG